MKRIVIALSLILFEVGLGCGRGAGAAEADNGARSIWAIVSPEGDYEAQLQNQKTVLDLLRHGVAVYWFAKGAEAPAGLKRGDYVVFSSRIHAKYVATLLAQVPAARRLRLAGVSGWKGYRLSFPRVVLDGNRYAKIEFYAWYHGCLRSGGFRFGNFGGSDARQLDGYGVLVVAGGSGGPDERLGQVLRDFQNRGGAYVGSCNACLIAKQPRGDKPKDRRLRLGLDLIEAQSPVVLDGGSASVTKNVAADHPVMWHLPPEFIIRHANGPVMEVTGPSCVALAVLKEAKWKSSKKAVAEGKPIWLAGQRPGQGRVVIFGNHPEFGSGYAGHRFPDGHRGVYDAIFWCTAGEERAIEPGNDKSDRPAGWFDLAAGKPQDAAKQIAAARETVSLAIKANEAVPKSKADWRGTHKKLAHAGLSSILESLEEMKMKGGGDKAGWFAGRREQLITELLTSLKHWPSPLKWESGEMMRNMPTELAVKFEEWARDYGYFLKANGRPVK